MMVITSFVWRRVIQVEDWVLRENAVTMTAYFPFGGPRSGVEDAMTVASGAASAMPGCARPQPRAWSGLHQ